MVTSRSIPVSVLWTLTDAPGTVAPEGSVTVPVTAVVCAHNKLEFMTAGAKITHKKYPTPRTSVFKVGWIRILPLDQKKSLHSLRFDGK